MHKQSITSTTFEKHHQLMLIIYNYTITNITSFTAVLIILRTIFFYLNIDKVEVFTSYFVVKCLANAPKLIEALSVPECLLKAISLYL